MAKKREPKYQGHGCPLSLDKKDLVVGDTFCCTEYSDLVWNGNTWVSDKKTATKKHHR